MIVFYGANTRNTINYVKKLERKEILLAYLIFAPIFILFMIYLYIVRNFSEFYITLFGFVLFHVIFLYPHLITTAETSIQKVIFDFEKMHIFVENEFRKSFQLKPTKYDISKIKYIKDFGTFYYVKVKLKQPIIFEKSLIVEGKIQDFDYYFKYIIKKSNN